MDPATTVRPIRMASVGREAIRDYNRSLAKEQVGRDEAVAAAARYGAVLMVGRAGRDNNEFGDWIVAQGLDRDIFDYRQERTAAMQIAEIVSHVAKETVDSTPTVNPFRGCPNSRPTNIMSRWRRKRGTLWTTAEARKVGERAATLLRDRRDRINERPGRDHVISWLEALVRDPFAFLMTDDDHSHEEVLESLEIDFGLRPAPPKPPPPKPPPPKPPPPKPPPPKPEPPKPEPKPEPPKPDPVKKAADNAEIETLRKENAAFASTSTRR